MDLPPLAPTMRLAEQRLGDTLGRYTLTGVLGVGGMATVYKAVHRNGDKVALKLLHPHFATREDVRARFVQEAYTANKVAHPGAVRVIDDDVAPDGSAFMVMDLLEGETLDAWQTRDGPMLPAEAVFDAVHQVLDVLVHAHARDIVHRDLKPENLHRASDGRVTVLDFGIARVLDEATAVTRTRTGSLLGTPAFMPPEQAQGRAERIDGRTDLWALGATAFALLSGRYVHEAETVALLNIASGTQEARAIGPLVPGLPPSLAAIVDKALKFEQADRWRSARAMQEALEDAFAEVFGRSLATPQQVALRAALPSAALPSAALAEPTEAAREEAATAVEPGSSRTRTSTTGAGVVSPHPGTNPPAAKGRARGWGVLALVALAGVTTLGAARLARTDRSGAPAPSSAEPARASARLAAEVPEAPSGVASASAAPSATASASAVSSSAPAKTALRGSTQAASTAQATAQATAQPTPSSTAAAHPTSSGATPAPPAVPPASQPKPSCDPWFILEDGKKRRKPWC